MLPGKNSTAPLAAFVAVCLAIMLGLSPAAPSALAAPAIRASSANPVPACVTPERLMAFLRARNTNLDPRFRDIAAWYKHYGEILQIRWDYAFFQMLLETNYLTYRRGNGKWGDVRPHQNNFAGIGATGGGVPGDSFPDVATGVRGQLEHLVVYSGERVPSPTAPRTQLKQNDILSWTAPLSKKRPITFQDLAGKWAADRAYGRSIELTAQRFREAHCTSQVAEAPAPKQQKAPPAEWKVSTDTAYATAIVAPRPAPARRAGPTIPPPQNEPTACRVLMASYGGKKTMLIRHVAQDAVEYTALRVLDGFEQSMTDNYIKAHAPGGTLVGEFASSDAAFARAYQLCPGAERG